jgi:hypothetical protein
VDLGSVEVYAIHGHYVNVLHFTIVVAVIMVVTYVRLLYVLLVDRQLVDYLDQSGKVTMVWLDDLVGD